MRRLLVSLAILGGVFITPSLAWGYTSPGQPVGYVNDFAGLLTPDQKNALEQQLIDFQKETSNEISVVTIVSLGDETIENYAVELFKEWGIGAVRRDNGVLLLIARDDRKIRIEVGYGLEGALTDATSGSIIRDIISPAFKVGDYNLGIVEGTQAIMQATRGEYVSNTTSSDQASSFDGVMNILFFLFFGLMWLAAILSRSKSWWAGGIVGALIGIVVSIFVGLVYWGIISIVILTPLGLLFDFIVSKKYSASKARGITPPWWIGGSGGGFGGSSGGFGGFGGGGSGGGGASGGW